MARAETGFQHHIVFSDYPPIAQTSEIVSRLLSPLAGATLAAKLADSGKTLEARPVDLAKESFLVYVPSRKPARGYGLMVFVPPWRQATAPPNWSSVLDDYGVILVSAERSGNEEKVISRRVPLALLAEANIVKRYEVDPDRIYIAGVSGGRASRCGSRSPIRTFSAAHCSMPEATPLV